MAIGIILFAIALVAAASGSEYICEIGDPGRRIHESDANRGPDCVDSDCQNTCRGGQCVAYVKCRCTRNDIYPPRTADWSPETMVKGADGKCNQNIATKTAIATFPGNGNYDGHAAVFIRCVNDVMVEVYDQWCRRSVGYTNRSLSDYPFNSFATITSSSNGPPSINCRSEDSGSTHCRASEDRC